MMRYSIYLILAGALSVSCNDSGSSKEDSQTKLTEIEGLSLPEGAARAGDYIYISNVGKEFNPLDKDGDGFISRHKLDGSIDSLRFIPADDTLHSPKGIGIAGNTLYVTDIDILKGYDLNSGRKTFSLDFSRENTLLLNDITLKNDSALFVSAMDIGKIFEVNLKDTSYSLVIEKPRPNGLFWDKENEVLYLGMFGREENANGDNGDIGLISFSGDSASYRELSDYQGNIDGVTKSANKLYFTDWLTKGDKGALLSLDLKTSAIDTLLQQGIWGPGDFYFDEGSRQFFIPKMRENELLILKK